MYKVYVDGPLNVLSNYCYAIFINGLRIPSPSFADDISLLTFYLSFLKTSTNICNHYGINWRYDFNHCKSGIVTFGETRLQHFESLKNRESFLGDTKVEELYEYKNLNVLKNYVGSFFLNIDDNIDKTKKKVGMIFSSNLDRRQVSPLTYAKFWRQTCLPTLLTFFPTLTLLLRLKCCQSWFLKNIFYVPKFASGMVLYFKSCPGFSKIFSTFLSLHLAWSSTSKAVLVSQKYFLCSYVCIWHGPLLQKLSGLNSIESEIAIKKLLFYKKKNRKCPLQ